MARRHGFPFLLHLLGLPILPQDIRGGARWAGGNYRWERDGGGFRALLWQGTGLHGVRPVEGTIGGGDGHPRSPVELGGDGIEL